MEWTTNTYKYVDANASDVASAMAPDTTQEKSDLILSTLAIRNKTLLEMSVSSRPK